MSLVSVKQYVTDHNQKVNAVPINSLKNSLGWGVFAKRAFAKGEFLLEYKGELVSEKEACDREAAYPANVGSFLFFFKHGSKSLWYVQ